jgi:hypothetical protein
MMSITVLTLSVARTGLYEQKIAANDHWNMRLSLLAASGMAQALSVTRQSMDTLAWQNDNDSGMQISRIPADSGDTQIQSELVLKRAPDAADFILIESSAQRSDGSGLAVRTSTWTRRLSVLTPLAETAPPLVLGGCIEGDTSDLQIRPQYADSDDAGTAAWTGAENTCSPSTGIDTHRGDITARSFQQDLWSDMFSVDREAFAMLAETDAELPAAQRIYYRATATDLHSGRWAVSLGNPSQHVVLQFPAALGCTEFAPGVQIFGVVFIDSACSGPITRQRLEIHGTLIINGDLDVTDTQLHLNHVSLADPSYTRLRFPALRSVPVPGTWSDF